MENKNIEKFYVLVENSELAMKLYTLIKEIGIKSTIVPTPREADHCCGLAVYLYNGNDTDKVEKIALENEIVIDNIYISTKEFDTKRNKFL